MPKSFMLVLPLLAIAVCRVSAAEPHSKVFPVDKSESSIARLKANVEYLMSLGEQEVIELVPTASGGIYFTACPNCDHGAEEAGIFEPTWDPRKPFQITCAGCGEVYPNNPKYPDDKFLEVAAPHGMHQFHYYERADGYRFFFRASADYWRRQWLERQAADLGDLYAATGDEAYARRAAVILLRFAEVFPGYAYRHDLPFRQKKFSPYTQNRVEGVRESYRTARWTWWAYMDVSRWMSRAYDAVRFWPGLAEMDGGRAAERIERDFFHELVTFVLGFEDTQSNMAPGLWRDTIYAGRVLHRPEWVHEVMRRFARLTRERFLYDGHYLENSPSYALQTIGGIQVVTEAIQGYSDPEGYVDPIDGTRFDNLNLGLTLPPYVLTRRTIDATRLPSGQLLPVNDTWAVHTKANRFPPRQSMQPVLAPAFGAAIMGGGEGEHQLHAYLNFTSGHHHKHTDSLSIGMSAFGRELLPDSGYTWTNYRLAWTASTMAHNTVVVNGRESGMDRLHRDQRLVAWYTNGSDFHLATAENDAAYPEITQRYRRTLAVVGHDSRDAYLIDLFEIAGGWQHDYILHGCLDEDAVAGVAGVGLSPFDGTLLNDGVAFQLPRATNATFGPENAFGFFRNLSQGRSDGAAAVEFRIAAAPQFGMRTLLDAGSNIEVYLGQTPSVRRAAETDAKLEDHPAPAFVARRRGEDLSTVFAAVHEPLVGEPRIAAMHVERQDGGVLVRVDHASGATDYLALGFDPSAVCGFATPYGELQFTGHYGLIRLNADGLATQAYLGGAKLSLGDMQLAAAAGWRGQVLARQRFTDQIDVRGSFDIAESVDANRAGPVILVRFADGTTWPFNIATIEKIDDGSRITVKEDPAYDLEDGKAHFRAFPRRSVNGDTVEYHLPGIARLD